jgi:hypothetical protein
MIKEATYLIPNKWVGIDYLCGVTGISRRKVETLINLDFIEKKKVGKNTMINLAKFNTDIDNNVFEEYL